ncbi:MULTISPECIES: ABC transporter ATP-binding protein [unclassified Mycolicibacterium]|uniref:ABC transporter ATP-binding protein n=1 Tax=unclassified Mycolicibacterium TaxID=2636767 RepID=UPI0012DCF105|nr:MULTISPECIES: ABC transporter ATP-binding protein [unclassified Mycolicibacterium]MUL85874.1 ABC transporter ATP-binding protein [Mycolicibacterium sp. CBMA 329]MUL90244.1 ABC transporter ATP-binding protein [Mycolicibacterium sp. CBMA 331]MUM01013.1 ABC transporter ATP-binding protein [Mycolicibacterium sp. CBMA 334]MUM29961.1 ABC transporter ATP-binding protein [Mycolicibacterium sp. CBMA 295]MUM39759.1 ABC transporter ATP-binding protein [Mycolicibacterium sp. CBMA 247]
MTTTQWRGRVTDEDNPDERDDTVSVGTGSSALPIDESLPRRREARALLWSLLRPYQWTVVVLALVVIVENVARLSVPILVQRGIDRGIPPILEGGPARELMLVVGTLCAVVIVQAISRMFFLRRSGRVGQRVLLELRRRVFRHFGRLDVAFHDRYTSGRVVSRSTNDVEAIQDMLETGFDSLITAALTLFGTAILLVALDWRLGLMCLAAFPVLVALVWWFRNESGKTYRLVRESAALVIVQFVETMTGIKAVQAYRREPRNQEIFDDVADEYRAINEKTFKLLAVFMPGVKLVGNLTTGVVLLYGGYLVLHGEMTIGTLAAFLLYLRMFFEPMQEISQFFNTFQSASSALEKLAGVLAQRPGIADPVAPVSYSGAEPKGDIVFHDVRFEYTPGRPVLPGLELAVPAGQTVALVGTTGAGKTTIAKLIARFYDPTAGSVTLDGVDLRELAQPELRRHVVMVTQENFMFAGTVADNIRFGRPEATDAQVRSAAAAVGADRFIEALPDGYDTDVAKRGGRLSAGQRQLVAFARAFLADPAVLILDEATSSLDIPSERMVQRALETVLADRTALVIAHRLSTVQIADRVLVLEHGRIVEDGAPRDLIGRAGGAYAALHRAWVNSLA